MTSPAVSEAKFPIEGSKYFGNIRKIRKFSPNILIRQFFEISYNLFSLISHFKEEIVGPHNIYGK